MDTRGPRQTPKAPDAAVAIDHDASQIPDSLLGTAWRLVSAPTTLLVLGILMGSYLTWAAFIPAALSPTEVATALGFGATEVTLGLGANDPLSGWPFWLLCLFIAIHLVARLLAVRDVHAQLATTVTVRATGTPDALIPRLSALAPRSAFFRTAEGQTLIFKRGATVEGSIALALGIIALILSFMLNKGRTLDAQLSVTTDDLTGEMTRSTVNIEGNLIERALPFRLVCSAPDPLDPSYTFPCTFAGPDALTGPGSAVLLRPGTTTAVEGYRLTPLRAAPAARTPTSALNLLWRSNGDAASSTRVTLEPGQTISVGEADKTFFRAGIFGGQPWFVMQEADPAATAATQVLLPSPVGAKVSEVALLHVERLDVHVAEAPPRWLFWLGLAFLLIGLLAWIIVPDLTFTATATTLDGVSTGTRVTISSLNRPARLAAWVTAVADLPRDPTP